MKVALVLLVFVMIGSAVNLALSIFRKDLYRSQFGVGLRLAIFLLSAGVVLLNLRSMLGAP